MRSDRVIYLVKEESQYNPELGRREVKIAETMKVASVYEKGTNLEELSSGKALVKVDTVRFRGTYHQAVSFIRIDGTAYDIISKKIYRGHTVYHLKERLV